MPRAFTFAINTLRFLSLVVCTGLLLISIPIGMLGAAAPQGEEIIPPWQVAGSVVGCAILLGSGFLMFALGWPARLQDVRYRAATCVLLLLPIAGGALLLRSTDVQLPHKGLAAAFTAFSALVLLLCSIPHRRP